MRIVVAFGLILVAMAFDRSAARAGSDCCIVGPLPAVISGLPPLPYATGYVFTPWTAAKPSCVIDQGPQVPARAYRTCLETGYVFPNEYPYIFSYGSGSRYGYRAFRHAPAYR
jgi:hypothetical protein